jgi:vitamin K-dependent gamma-carboxylase
MVIDIPQERGLSNIYSNWEPDMCYFPMFNILQPVSVEWMHVIYVTMFVGAIGIMLGLFYRISCVLFMVSYWYMFLLDKAIWNNHSYLYGLISVMLLLTDCNRYW